IPWNDIDTSSMFTKAVFSPSVPIFEDFAIHIDFTDFIANDDTIGFVCGADGTGTGISIPDYTMFKFKSTFSGNYYWSDISFFHSGLNVCLAIWPVVDESTADIGGDYFVNGIKLGQNFPNPGINSTQIEYELETNSEVTIEIFNQKGAKVIELNEGNKTRGKHSTTIELSNFSSGIYYYSLKAGKNRLTKKMSITK
ncbi:MAG: T9SS type A sorting domain-containing protein, partial [Saprospiraceae bacterium]|nr:T9SS type A sorting domain-containing protein [Saprospiraceae bacterium]